MSEFEEALSSVQTGNEAQPTPEATTPNTGNEVAQSATPVEDDYPQSVRDYLSQNPDHKDIADNLNKQFKSAFTPRLQEAADLRKRFEGIDENTLNAIRHLQQLVTNDPRNAAEYLRQQAQLLEGPQAPEAPSTPEYEPATEVEAYLLRQFAELNSWKEQQSQQFQTIQRQQAAVQIQADFAKLEREYGVQVPVEDRARAWELSEQTGGKISPTDAYFLNARSTLLPTLIQKARNEASSVVQTKAGMSVPGNLAERGGPAPNKATSFDEIFNEIRGINSG